MENTLGEFWHMILQEGCRLIIMLCSLVEDDKEKCAPYYPTLVGSTLLVETTTITSIERNTEGLLTMSLFKVKNGDTEILVRHLQYTKWPDHSSPVKTDAALELHREISDTHLQPYQDLTFVSPTSAVPRRGHVKEAQASRLTSAASQMVS
ncbi:hypothetical protein GCK32_011052 [Trichostrongylus colubriformis]|uniref:Tyrosine-protein phosphatase domain-containing protein n=1 Tax=Trichostrongylus colubriformis TaxID=6319 RepID=A0AAN8IB94_TRICO